MQESQLFYPLKTWLEGQGYSIHSEVQNCDLVARKGEELILIETKLRLSFQLLLQAVRRQEMANSVYMAVALNKARSYPSNFASVKGLLRRLGLGLIFVRFLKTKTKVEVAIHPSDPQLIRRPKKRQAIIREIDGRYAEFNRSGEVVGIEKITAYKQQTLYLAHLLSKLGEASPADFRKLGLRQNSGSILSKNYYGWFERISRGVYRLSQAGEQALVHYAEKLAIIVDALEER